LAKTRQAIREYLEVVEEQLVGVEIREVEVAGRGRLTSR
jgi:hypothetical protein